MKDPVVSWVFREYKFTSINLRETATILASLLNLFNINNKLLGELSL